MKSKFGWKIVMKSKLLGILLAGLTISLSSLSVAIEEEDLGCIVGNCVNGRGTLVSISEEHGETRYGGNFIDGKYNGYGRLEYVEEGTVYKGIWLAGKKHGRGVLWDKSNNVYMGEWRNDRRNGEGSQFFKVKDFIEDEHGEQWMIKNTENYTGGFKNDVFFGDGSYRWADGTLYVGGWVGSKKHGEGYYDFGNGVRSHRRYEFDKKIFEERISF